MAEVYSPLQQPATTGSRPPRKLLDQVRDVLRAKHYSYRTEQAYVGWIRRFILFHEKHHPAEMGGEEVERFLTWLATNKSVAASTQTQALSALLFLYKHVLKIELPLLDAVRAKRPKRLPVVLSQQEVQRLLDSVGGAHGVYRVMAGIMYGSGVRLMECWIGKGDILLFEKVECPLFHSLTLNCRHIANATVLPGVYRLLDELGLSGMLICTPMELLGGQNDAGQSDT